MYRAGGGFRHTYHVIDGVTLGEKIVFVGNGTTHYMEYMRDENGDVYGFIYDGSTYFLEKNALGDVKYLLDGSGNVVAKYTYDAWGKVISVTDASGNAITDWANVAHLNPFRYRSYYYDFESGLYYLKSRYYDPVLCRFVNADGYVSTGTGINGYNMFAYCNNNPISHADPDGCFVITATTILGSIAAKLIVAAVVVVAAVAVAELTKTIINDTADVIDNARIRRDFRQRDDTKTDEKEKDIAIPETSQSQTKIYRYGGTNPSNLTPSQRDVDLYPATKKGLSFSTIPKPGCSMTTIEAINATGIVYAVQDGPTHVSVHPIGGTLEDWHNAGSSSVWTTAVKSVVIKWDGGN